MPSFGKISPVCFIKRAFEYIVGTKDAKPDEDYLLFSIIKVLVKPFHSTRVTLFDYVIVCVVLQE